MIGQHDIQQAVVVEVVDADAATVGLEHPHLFSAWHGGRVRQLMADKYIFAGRRVRQWRFGDDKGLGQHGRNDWQEGDDGQ